MKKSTRQAQAPHTSDYIKGAAKTASFSGLFLSLMGTFFIWAGVNAFNCSEIIWKTSIAINLISFIFIWMIYFRFKNTEQLIGKGLIDFLLLFDLFWLFGFSMFYFYFIFAPLKPWVRATVLASFTTALILQGCFVLFDIKRAFNERKDLFDQIYCRTEGSIIFNKNSVNVLQEACRDRTPFRSVFLYAAMLVMPITLILNRLLSPVVGDGHGVFIVTAFLSLPILQWGMKIFTQTMAIMIYFPIKLKKKTGAPVLIKDW
jgi:hypothetical protein